MTPRDASNSPTADLRGLLLALRGRAGLTQRELAALLGRSERAIAAWETGGNYPSAEALQALIALYLERGVFTPGQERAEAVALWEAARDEAPRLKAAFDHAWFAARLASAPAMARSSASGPEHVASGQLAVLPLAPRGQDWGEAPDVGAFHGRAQELQTLTDWMLTDGCRLVALLGMGGMGKTALAAHLARALAPRFDALYWRSLRNAPPPAEWLAGAILFLSAQQALPADGEEARLRQLLDLLRERRSLLVLDNLETVLEPGAPELWYREGCAGYAQVLQLVGEASHASCLLVTSREVPPAVGPRAGAQGPVRALRLGGVDEPTGRALLEDRGLVGDAAAWEALIARYGGNALALQVVSETIRVLFAGEITAFLAQGEAVFGDIRRLLDAQVARLSPTERAVLDCLAVEREPVAFDTLVADLSTAVPRRAALEALEALGRRSLLEQGEQGATFTLQPVVLEHVTERLVERLADEIDGGQPARLVSQTVMKAQTKDYVRRSQERLIGEPILRRLNAQHDPVGTEQRLLALLDGWRERPRAEQGYGPGNAVNLLRLLRGDLRGLDCSRLALRQVYLAEVDAQDASLVDTHLAETVLAETFDFPFWVALSEDSAVLAVGTATGQIWLWQVADRTPLWAVQGHTGGIWGVALTADGRLLASGGGDGTVRLWETSSGRPLATLQGHISAVWGVAVTTDGRLVASGGEDGTVRLWEATGGRPLATLQGHTGVVRGVALTADGRLVASAGEDGTVRLWEATSSRPLATLQGHTGGVWGVALTADGRLVASGGEDGTVRLREATSGRPLATLQGHTSGVRGVALSADGQLLVSGGGDGTVRLWEATSGRPLATLQGHTDVVRGVALSADGRLVASGGGDGTVRLWETSSGRPLATLQGHTGGVRGVALSADGQLLVSAGGDGTVRLWEASTGQPLATLQGHTGGVRGVALTADGQLLASGGEDGTVRLWEATSGRTLATLQGHTSAVRAVALTADGQLLASGGEDGTVRLWEATSGRTLATLQGHTSAVRAVALTADGQLLASGAGDGTVRLWEATSGRPLATLQGHTNVVRGVALTADGRFVASGGGDGTVRLWETSSGRPVATLQGHAGGVWSVALTADGRLVASGDGDGTVRLWETSSRRPLATLQGHTGGVWGVALTADGQLLASGSFDGTVRLWDANSGALLRTLRPERRYERLDVTGLSGVTPAQRAALLALGAVDRNAPETPA